VIAAQHPDLIVFLGDAINSTWALGAFKQLMLTLHNIAPVVAVQGSQDRGAWWDSHNVYAGTGAVLLRDEATERNIRGTELYIWGQDYLPPHLLPREPPPSPGAFTILLQHGPDLMPDAVQAHFDLYLAGHTHGGQIALPFYGAVFTNSRYDKKYESGMFQVGSTTLYVNRGLGFAKWPQPEARFLARPEVTVIDLVGK
jgi:predicted MPP superfamily phosphohydrolase